MALLGPQFIDVLSSVQVESLMLTDHLECGRPSWNTELWDCKICPGTCRCRIVPASGISMSPIPISYLLDMFGYVKRKDRWSFEGSVPIVTILVRLIHDSRAHMLLVVRISLLCEAISQEKNLHKNREVHYFPTPSISSNTFGKATESISISVSPVTPKVTQKPSISQPISNIWRPKSTQGQRSSSLKCFTMSTVF